MSSLLRRAFVDCALVGALLANLASSASARPATLDALPPLKLAFRGLYRTGVGRDEWRAEVRLVVGLGALTGPRLPMADGPPQPSESEEAPHGTPSAPRRDAAEVSAERAAQPAPAAAQGEPAATEERAESRPALTPTLARATVSAVLRASGARANGRRLEAVLSRARLSALLPELRVRVGRNLDESLRFAPTSDDPYYYTTTGGADWRLEARVTWQLDRLLYVKEELSAERYRRDDEQEAWKRAERAVEALVDWQRGLLEELDDALPEEERARGALRRLEARVRLDLLTSGWFSRHLARAEKAQARRPLPRKKRKNSLAGGSGRE